MTHTERQIYIVVAILAIITILCNIGKLPHLDQLDQAYIHRNNPVDQNVINGQNPDCNELNPGCRKINQEKIENKLDTPRVIQ